jgi:enoyl-CoA hydratase/carnithine racemase
VASEQSRFHANFSALGFHHGFGLTATLPRIVGAQRAHDLLLTSTRIHGARAHEIGLVDRLVRPGQERSGAVELAREIASRAPLAVRAIRGSLRRDLAREVAAALEIELDEQQRLWRTKDSQIGIAASLARTQPTFTGE